MNKSEKLADLRHHLARYGLPPDRPALALGIAGRTRRWAAACCPAPCTKFMPAIGAPEGFAACLAIKEGKDKSPCSG